MTRLFVQESGAGERVILVHGGLTDGSLTWYKQAPLAEHYRLLNVNRRGYAGSPETGGEDWDLDAEGLVELLDEGDAHLVTHSAGGFSAMLAAGARPERVLSLTLIEPPMVGLVPDHPDVVAVLASIESGREAAIRAIDDDEALEGWLVGFLRDAGVDVTRIKRPLDPSLVRAGRMLVMGRPVIEYVPPLDAVDAAPFPKLVITGRHRDYYEAIGDVLERRLHAQRVLLEGRGHAIPLLGEPFNEVLLAFLRRASAERVGRAG